MKRKKWIQKLSLGTVLLLFVIRFMPIIIADMHPETKLLHEKHYFDTTKNTHEKKEAMVPCFFLDDASQKRESTVNEKAFLQNFEDYIYYNASLVMISSLYVVLHYDKDFIILEDGDRLFFPFGVFSVSNESGIHHFSLYGGWLNSKVWIYGHDGFIKKDGLWTIIIGKCNEINITTYRGGC